MSHTTTPQQPKALHLHADDNIVVLIGPVKTGDPIEIAGTTLTAPADLGLGHKLALTEIADGEDIRKYGAPIGLAVGSISPSSHVHLHNIKSRYTVIEDIEGTNA